MELTPGMMYWITRLDGISIAAGLLGFLCLLTLAICVPIYSVDKNKDVKAVRNISGALLIFFLLIAVFVPTTKDVFVIYGVPALAKQGEKAWSTFGDDVEAAVKAWLKKQAAAGKESADD